MNESIFFALAVIPERRICTLCRTIQPAGLMGVMRLHGQSEKTLCDRCLYLHCKPFGLILQSVHLLRQAVTYRLSGADGAIDHGNQLMRFALDFEASARGAWPRYYPVAKADCEHCLMAAYPHLEEPDSDLLLAVFRAFHRLRFKIQSGRDLYFIRHVEFKDLSDEMKTTAIERLEQFIDAAGENELCPESGTSLRLLDGPIGAIEQGSTQA